MAVAIVTGGTRGIGAAIAKGLKAAGNSVAVTYHGNDEAAAKFNAETGVAVYRWDVADVTASADGVAKVAARARAGRHSRQQTPASRVTACSIA